MRAGLDPFSFLVFSIAGWINQRQQKVIDIWLKKIAFCGNRSAVAACGLRMTSVVG
jgi:hypothetical protein